MEKKIFTISREYGAGGLPVGHFIAEKLGIPFYDKKLVEHVAEESGFAPKFIEEHGEHAPSRSVFSYAFAPQGVPGVMNGLSTSDYLWNVQCSVILQLAEQGPCVIVGRNADYILKDRDDVFNVYLHASTPARIARILGDGVVTKDPEGLLEERDKRRRLNYQHYTGRTWGMSQNYHMCLDTSVLGFEKSAELIIEAAKACTK